MEAGSPSAGSSWRDSPHNSWRRVGGLTVIVCRCLAAMGFATGVFWVSLYLCRCLEA